MPEYSRKDDEILIFPWRIQFGILEKANREAMKLGIPVCQYMEQAVKEKNDLAKLAEDQERALKVAASRDS